MPLPELTTPRLSLRALEPGDLEPFFRAYSQREAMRYWSSPPLADLEAAREYLAGAIERMQTWSILQREDGAWLGTAALHGLDLPNQRAEVGFLLDPAHWGRGYGREAVGAVLRHGFEGMGLHRIEADVDPRNEASLRVLEAAGFTREGYLKERWHVGGERQDSLLLGLLAPEWRARPSR